MGAIIGPHVINGCGPHLAQLRRLQPRAVTVLDPAPADMRDLRAACPNTAIVGRIYVPDGEVSSRILADPAGAAAWAHDLVLRQPAFGLVNFWQVQNEVCQFWDQLDALNTFECRRMAYADEAHYGCAIGGFSVGNLDMPQTDRLALYRKLYPAFRRAVAGRHVVCLHQYGAPDLWGPAEKGGADWLIHRLEHQLLPRLPAEFAGLRFVVTEYGIDGLLLDDVLGYTARDGGDFGVGLRTPAKDLGTVELPAVRSAWADQLRGIYGPRGWQYFTTAERYAQDLINIGQYCEQWADRILGYCVFTLGSNPPWGSYDIAGDVLERLANHYAGLPADPPEPPDEEEPVTGVQVFDETGAQRDLAWLVAKYNVKQLFAVVPAGEPKFVLTEVRETGAEATLSLRTLAANGAPLSGVQVVYSWADGTYLPPTGWKSVWRSHGSVQQTDGNGWSGFGLGVGSYYLPPDMGPHCCWVLHNLYASDAIDGIGMLPGTDHHGPLKLTFTLQAATPPVDDKYPVKTSLRDAAWNRLGVPFNPAAAFGQAAAAAKLGAPLTPEFGCTVGGQRYWLQDFVAGYVYTTVDAAGNGDWAHVKVGQY